MPGKRSRGERRDGQAVRSRRFGCKLGGVARGAGLENARGRRQQPTELAASREPRAAETLGGRAARCQKTDEARREHASRRSCWERRGRARARSAARVCSTNMLAAAPLMRSPATSDHVLVLSPGGAWTACVQREGKEAGNARRSPRRARGSRMQSPSSHDRQPWARPASSACWSRMQ